MKIWSYNSFMNKPFMQGLNNPSDMYERACANWCDYIDIRFDNLKDLLENHCRNHDKGKPIKPSGFRLFYALTDKSKIKVMHYSQPIFTVDDKNILTWELSMADAGGQAQVNSMSNYLPVCLYRLGTSNYSVVTMWDIAKGCTDFKELPYIFNGLQYNLLTGEYLNAKQRQKTVERKDERKIWRSLLTPHKKMLLTMASLGGFKLLDKDVQEVIKRKVKTITNTVDSYYYHSGKINLEDTKITKYILSVMKSEKLNNQYLNLLRYNISFQMSSYSFRMKSQLGQNEIQPEHIRNYLNEYSTAFKQFLNVFESIGFNSQKKTLSNNLTDEQADELIELFSDNSMAEHKRNVEKE